MADSKITSLCALATGESCDLIPIVDVSCPAATKKITFTNLRKNMALSELAISAKTEAFILAASDETSCLTTGTAKTTFRMPYAFTVTDVRASLNTAATGACLVTVDINDGGTTIMATNKITIDASETTSTTAATAPGVTDTALADDAEITIDIDKVGNTTTGIGLKVYIIGYQT
jgi:hypothetical protein